jgi:hypothetical protein
MKVPKQILPMVPTASGIPSLDAIGHQACRTQPWWERSRWRGTGSQSNGDATRGVDVEQAVTCPSGAAGPGNRPQSAGGTS